MGYSLTLITHLDFASLSRNKHRRDYVFPFYFFLELSLLLMEWKILSEKSRPESLSSFWYSFSTILLLSKNLNTIIIYEDIRPL